MYHELLMALLGYTGDVFQYDGRFIKVSKDVQVPLFHPSELLIIDEVLEVASLYKRLEAFLEEQLQLDLRTSLSQSSTNTSSSDKCKLVGLYVSSLCNGVRDIIEVYQKEIAELEMEILEDPYVTVNDIRVKVEPFRAVFQALDSMIMKVQGQSKSSAIIVEIVKNEYDMNVHLQDSFSRLIPWINRILYNQIINWVTFGSLHDPKGEFFVKQKTPDQTDGVRKVDSRTIQKSKIREKYYVDYAVVPSHLPVPLTDRILYIGASIGILSNSEKTKESIVLKQQQFYEKLKSIPIETFRIEELSSVIEELAIEVGKDLHHLVVAETDLPKHLGIIKDFYLTGRGELFHDFLQNLKCVPMTKNSLLADVRQAFILAATRVQVQDEILQRIHILLPSDIAKPSMKLVMSSIALQMEDEWPLHILFSQESLRKYNELFRFLLQIRLLQVELNTIWLSTRRVFRFPVPLGPAELRNVMSYFIDHLQHYLQEDVLENQYAILANAIQKSENFDQILVAHAQFQSNILAQSFRSSKQLRHFLDEIINVCCNYAAFINAHILSCETNDLPVNEGISQEVMDFSRDFRRHVDLLLNLLKNMALNPQSGQYLGQFLLRLDFNSYFSSMISGFNV